MIATTQIDSAIRRTRFPELGYTKDGPRLWRFCDLTDNSRSDPARIGQQYPTKSALLADLERYASQFGCEGAQHVETSIAPRATAPTEIDRASWDDYQAFRVWTEQPSFMEDKSAWKCTAAFWFLADCLTYIASLQDAGIDTVFQSPAETRRILATDRRLVAKVAESSAVQ